MFGYVFTVLLAFSALGFGQIDPAARPFLENVRPVAPQVPVRSLDYTLCYSQADEVDICVRTALDFVKRRMLTQIRHGHETVAEYLYTGGQVTSRAEGRTPTVPADQAAVFKRIFAYSDDIVRTGGSLPEKVFRATYDDFRSYGEVVRGEQVTAEVMAASFTLSQVAPRRTSLKLTFSSDRKLLALISDVPPERLMHVLANPAEPVLVRRMLSGSVYWLRGGKPVLAHTQRLTRYRLNPKLPDALFTFGSGAGAAGTSPRRTAPAETPK